MPLQPDSPLDALRPEGPTAQDREQARRFLEKRGGGLRRKLALWRDLQVARRALKTAGEPGLVLDMPSGLGQFWPVLAEHGNRVILAADDSPGLLAVACQRYPEKLVQRVSLLQTSLPSLDLPANAVDCVFCMRLLQFCATSEQRLALLKELHRVTRDTLIVSLWVDGNFKSWKRKRSALLRAANNREPSRRSVVSKAGVENEFYQTGFKIVGHHDVLPGVSMWRVYVLRKEF